MFVPFAFIAPGTAVILGIVVLLLFGSRIPNVMRSLGQGITEFKKGMKEIEDQSDEDEKLTAAK